MAQSGFTPIQLYYSVTSTNVPSAGNLAYGELAVNAADGKLYYKNSATGTVKVLADGAVATGNLPGGTAGSVVYQSATGVTAYLPIGTNGYILTSNGSIPTYVNPASLTVGTAASATFATTAGSATTATTATSSTNIASGSANQIVYQSGSGTTAFATAPTVTGTVLGWNGSSFSWVSAPAATTSTNIAGGAQYQIPYQSGVGTTAFSANLTFNSSTNTAGSTNITATSALTGATVTANKTISTTSTTGAVNYGTLSYTDTNIFSSYQTSVNSYAQKIMQNTSNGSTASVDFIVSNDQGTASTYYGDFGMNSSTFSGTGPFQAANAVYLYSISSDLVIGTKSSNYLRLVTNDNAADSMTISPNGSIAFNGNYGVAGQVLQSNGTSGSPTWGSSAAVASAGGVIWENSTTISTSYTLTTSKNGLSVGPITIASGAVVTVPTGQRWVVL